MFSSYRASLVAQMVKNRPAMQKTQVRRSLGREDFLEKEMATHSSILAWKISRTEKPGRLPFMSLQRVGHDWGLTLSLSALITFFTHFPSEKPKLLRLLNFLLWYMIREKTIEKRKNPTKCFSAGSSSIPTGLHVSRLQGMQEKENNQCDGQPGALKQPLNMEINSSNHINTYMWGMVVLKISNIQLHVSSQTSGLNFSPLDITKFSKQFVPDRANCSLSAK